MEIAKLMGIKMTKVRPMTFNEADNGQANVNYHRGGEFKENCQSCVVVHEARLRGLNITARGYSSNRESVSYELGEHFENAWINPKNGKIPHPTIIKYDKDWLQKALKQMKADGRYHVGLNYNDNTGHVIVAESIKGKVIFYDPQSNDFIDIKSRKISSIEILKIDKLNINKDVIKQISESI